MTVTAKSERRVRAEQNLANIVREIRYTTRLMMETDVPAMARQYRLILDRLQWQRRAAKRAVGCARYDERHQ